MLIAMAQHQPTRLIDRITAWWIEVSISTLLRWVLATYIIGAVLEVLKVVLR